MNTDLPSSPLTNRSTRTSVSAILILGLLLGVTIGTVQPGMRALHRDAAATRQIAQTLARAVLDLAGGDKHRPAIRTAGATRTSPASATLRSTSSAPEASPRVPLLLEALLSLPPPRA